MQTRQEFYCQYCDSDFLIETLSLSQLNFCPNCGAEQDEKESDEYNEEQDEWDE